jgi:hypothetical protein
MNPSQATRCVRVLTWMTDCEGIIDSVTVTVPNLIEVKERHNPFAVMDRTVLSHGRDMDKTVSH